MRERPLVSFITSWMVSPLAFATDVTTLLIETCRQRIPVVLSAAPMAGSTAPVTLAGMLAQLTAEQLSGVVLAQLVRRGLLRIERTKVDRRQVALYHPTKRFLEVFGLECLDDLPQSEELDRSG